MPTDPAAACGSAGAESFKSDRAPARNRDCWLARSDGRDASSSGAYPYGKSLPIGCPSRSWLLLWLLSKRPEVDGVNLMTTHQYLDRCLEQDSKKPRR